MGEVGEDPRHGAYGPRHHWNYITWSIVNRRCKYPDQKRRMYQTMRDIADERYVYDPMCWLDKRATNLQIVKNK